TAPGDPGEPVFRLVLLHLLFKRAVAEGLVAVEVEPLDLDLGALLDVERQMDQFRSAWQLFDCVSDLGILIALFGHQATDDALDAPDQPGIDERVETNLEVLFLQLVVDLRLLDLLAALVVDDLDALALLHLVDDALPDHAVGIGIVDDFDRQILEEVGGPETLEVLDEDLLGLLVVRYPDPIGRPAHLRLDVIQVRLRLDDRHVTLRGERQLDEPNEGR